MNKVIIITGASSGFGKATAERLAKRGHTVYGICRREMSHPTIHYMQADIRDKEHIKQIVNTIYEKEKHIDVLINNAGMGIGGSLELATTEEIQVQMGTNFMGCVNMCQEVLPYMRRQRSGKIINLSSIGGIMGLPYQGYYSASKFAIEGFSEALSAEVKGLQPQELASHFGRPRLRPHLQTLSGTDRKGRKRRIKTRCIGAKNRENCRRTPPKTPLCGGQFRTMAFSGLETIHPGQLVCRHLDKLL